MITNQWYIVCFTEELKKGKPIQRKIVGKEVVAFQTENGKIYVLEDRCCHRNVHLSLGYVKGEHIKCGYHGWEFNGDGQCAYIPSLPLEEKIPKTACIKSYSVQVKYKAVWAWFGDEDKKDSVPLPPMHEMEKWPIVFNYHAIRANIKLVAESLFDAYHINHVHRNSIKTFMGNLHNEKMNFNLRVTDTSLEGNYDRANEGSFFEKIYFGFSKTVDTHFGYWFPHTSKLDLRFKKHFTMPARQMVIYEHFYEIDEDHVMMIQITTWHNIFRFNPWFAKWFMLKKSMRIVEEDIAFLESNKHWHDQTNHRDLLIKSDEVTFEFTRLWNKNIQPYGSTTQEDQAKAE